MFGQSRQQNRWIVFQFQLIQKKKQPVLALKVQVTQKWPYFSPGIAATSLDTHLKFASLKSLQPLLQKVKTTFVLYRLQRPIPGSLLIAACSAQQLRVDVFSVLGDLIALRLLFCNKLGNGNSICTDNTTTLSPTRINKYA